MQVGDITKGMTVKLNDGRIAVMDDNNGSRNIRRVRVFDSAVPEVEAVYATDIVKVIADDVLITVQHTPAQIAAANDREMRGI